MSHHRYEPRGLQAINPQALFWLFPDVDNSENDERDDATIVKIRGPITQHGWWFDSYESIRERINEACAKAAPNVVLRIDSPGGEVAGLFDTARAIRAACEKAGKRLMVHVEGQCSSAAYALACTADKIVASRTADIGSIGIMAVRFDDTVADALNGHKVALITSGERKADWNPHAPLGAEELAAHQAEVDGLAAEFFDLVAMWRGMSTESVAALEAASFRGSAAVKAGLVDELGSFDHLLASLDAAKNLETETMSKEEEARDALRSIAEDEERSEEDREKARRALAALDGDEEDSAQDDDGDDDDSDVDVDVNVQSDDDDADAEDDEEAKAKCDEKSTKASATVSASTAGELTARGSKLEQQVAILMRDREASERKRLIAAHGGVPKGMARLLATKPLSEVRAILAELPKPKKPKLGDAAATATVSGTRGGSQEQESRLPPDEARAMKRAMGLDKEQFGVVNRGNVQILGGSLDEEVSR